MIGKLKKICELKGKSRAICEGKSYSNKKLGVDIYQRAIDIGYGQIKSALQSSKPLTIKCYIDLNMGTPYKKNDGKNYIYTYQKMIEVKEDSCQKPTCNECDRNKEVKYVERPQTSKIKKVLIDDLEYYLDQFNTSDNTTKKLNLLESIKTTFKNINKNLIL